MPRIEPPHQPGDRVLRDYEIQELIGSGGHAFVYRARAIADNEEVAIKVIPEQPGRVTNVRERAKREARVLVRLDHPNIVKVITGGEARGITYIVMEMMRGKVLRDVIHAVRRLSVHEALSIAVQVAEGMLEAHRLNVIHRDLKPENVFVLQDNRVKILDFGIAKFLGYGYESTQRDLAHGTVTYMSPEQLQGFGVTDKSDVYALGTMLWEMMVGYPPVVFGVQEISMMALSHRQIIFAAPSLDEIHPEVPGYVARLVRRSLAKHPPQRETSEQFLASLRQALERLSHEQAPAVLLNRDLLTADASPLLNPKPSSSHREGQPRTRRAGTPQAHFGPAGTEVIQTIVSPESEPAEPSPNATAAQGFPTVYGVSLFHPAPESDLTQVPVPQRALPRQRREDGATGRRDEETTDEPPQPEKPPIPQRGNGATADESPQPKKPPIRGKNHDSTTLEPSLSMTSTATWVTPFVPKWLVAAAAGAIAGGLFVFAPKLLTERWAPWLLGHSHSEDLIGLESAKPDPDALEPTPAPSARSQILAKTQVTPPARTLTSAEPEPVAATPPTPAPTPIAAQPAPTPAKRRPKRSTPARPSEQSSPAVVPRPPPAASGQSWIRMHPEPTNHSPLWIESPQERDARKAAAQNQSPPKAPPSPSTQTDFDPEELIFK